jgi:hypothetical protein
MSFLTESVKWVIIITAVLIGAEMIKKKFALLKDGKVSQPQPIVKQSEWDKLKQVFKPKN